MFWEWICRLIGHKFNVWWYDGVSSLPMGKCRRCGILSTDRLLTCKCCDCGCDIVSGDDDAFVCVGCGGRNRRALPY